MNIEVFPGIDKDQAICGGEARIARTRIPIWLLVVARRSGWSEGETLANYPSLCADDLSHAWAYFAANADEIERDIYENESA
jgi:uncharacterized protein (DUF433 family)